MSNQSDVRYKFRTEKSDVLNVSVDESNVTRSSCASYSSVDDSLDDFDYNDDHEADCLSPQLYQRGIGIQRRDVIDNNSPSPYRELFIDQCSNHYRYNGAWLLNTNQNWHNSYAKQNDACEDPTSVSSVLDEDNIVLDSQGMKKTVRWAPINTAIDVSFLSDSGAFDDESSLGGQEIDIGNCVESSNLEIREEYDRIISDRENIYYDDNFENKMNEDSPETCLCQIPGCAVM